MALSAKSIAAIASLGLMLAACARTSSLATIVFGPGDRRYNDGCGYEAFVATGAGQTADYGIYHLVRGLDVPLGTELRGDFNGRGERNIADISHGTSMTIDVVFHAARLSDVIARMHGPQYNCAGPRSWSV